MNRLSLTLALALVAAAPLSALAQDEEIVFSPHQKQDIAISKELAKAQSSIYMALYSISHESDWVDDPGPGASQTELDTYQAFKDKLDAGEVKPYDMIKHKAAQGVRCRLILHRAALDSWAVERAKAYEDIGVEVRWTHKTMHHKFAVIDRKTLINGSGNWSRGAAERYSENTTIFRDGHYRLTWKFLREFYFMWYKLTAEGRAEKFDRTLLPIAEPDTAFFVPRKVRHKPLDPVQAYFTSENGSTSDYVVADKIIDEMRKAEKSITIMINHFNMRRISQALIDVHKDRNENADPNDDVEIKVLMDMGEYDHGKIGISRSRELENAGIEARYKMYSLAFYYKKSQFMHHKVMVVDGKRLITGSYNWSRTAEHKNYENITLHQGPTQQDVIQAVEGEFTRLWDMRRDLYDDFRDAATSQPGDADYKRYVPMHFLPDSDYYHTPMTLSRSEIDLIREPLEVLGFTAPDENDPDSGNFHDKLFFDKETGESTSAAPLVLKFIDGEDNSAAATGLAGAVTNP